MTGLRISLHRPLQNGVSLAEPLVQSVAAGPETIEDSLMVRRSMFPYNTDMSNISLALTQLEQERTRLVSQVDAVRNAISALNGTGSKGVPGPRKLSAAARAKIAAAQRARWAKAKGQKVVPITAGKKK